MQRVGEVLFNLDFYNGEDSYSDGPIEDELLELVKTYNEDELLSLIYEDSRWPILYHLSPIRRNLIDWIPMRPSSSVLEIGAGCGALTKSLCEKAEKVVSVELSKKRAEILAYRNQEFRNLEVRVGNFSEMPFEKEGFDYITLIGVLEYAETFLKKGNKSHTVFLNQICEILKPDGELWLAIENKFGLKYWAGAPEDHTGHLFDGLENYPHNSKVKTFSRHELTVLLENSGFKDLSFYYPSPDYKLPTEIYSDDFLPDPESFNGISPNFDYDRLDMFHEQTVFTQLIRNDMFPFFANSFLVLCKKS